MEGRMKVLQERQISLVVAIVLAVAGRVQGSGENTREIKDLAGREVALPNKVERVIALGPGALRFVAYLGGTDRIVGIEDMEKRMVKTRYFRPYARTLDETFFKLPVVGTGGPGKLPDFEKVMMCRPDVIVAVNMDVAQVKNMQFKTGVPVVCLSYGQLGVWRKEAQTSLNLLGKILGREQRAKELNAYIESLQQDLANRTKKSKKTSAYFGGISFKGAHGLTSTEAGYPPSEMANAVNLANELGKKGHLFVDKEQILVWNPNVIFVDIGSKVIVEQDFEKNRNFYRLLKAARSGKVFSLLPYNYYNTNIEIALLNAYFVGKCLYPEEFKDVDIDRKANEILNTFLGIGAEEEMPAYHVIRFPEEGSVSWGQEGQQH